MEYVDGVPLDRYCALHQLNLTARLDLFNSICDAVRYAHQNLIVHRDLKPNNILVTETGAIKLLDFGIAKLLHPDGGGGVEETTLLGLRPLTPNYASPEQLRGDTIGTTTDVYALGVVLYELLTSERPYTLDHPDPAVIDRLLAEGLRLPSVTPDRQSDRHPVAARTLRGDLDTIVLRCLQREPERRYGSVEALSEDLHRYRVGLPIRARKDTVSYRVGRFLKRNKLAASLLASLFVLTASFAGTMTWQVQRVRAEQIQTAHERDKATLIRDFLSKIFTSADPFKPDTAESTASHLVDQAIALAHSDLSDDPLMQAVVQSEAAILLNHMSLHEQSLELSETALATFEANEGGDLREYLRALRNKGGNLQWLGRLTEALESHQKAVNLSRTAFGEDSADLAAALNNLGATYATLERNREAEIAFRDVLRIDRRTNDPSSPLIVTDITQLARALMGQQKFDDARASLNEAHEIQQNAGRSESMQTAYIHRTLGDLAHAIGDVQATLTHSQESLRLSKLILGDGDHRNVAVQEINLAESHYNAGNLSRAIELADSALDTLERRATDRSPATGFAMIVQGRIEMLRDRNDAALRHLEKARQTFLEIDPDHPDAATILIEQAQLRQQTGHPREAADALSEADTIWRKRGGGPNYDPHKLDREAGAILLAMGAAKKAQDVLRTSRATLVSARHPNRLTLSQVNHVMAQALAATRESEEAARLLREVLRYRNDQLRPDHWDTLEAVIDLADVLRVQPDHEDEARTLYQDAIGRARQSAEAPPIRRRQALQARAHHGLASMDAARDRTTQAREHWRRAAALLEPLQDSSTIAYRASYARVLLALERSDEAEPILHDLFERGWRPVDLVRLATEHGIAPRTPAPAIPFVTSAVSGPESLTPQP